MIRHFILTIISVLTCLQMYAQQATPSVIASAGNDGFVQVYGLSWTVGEAIIHTYDQEEAKLLQGFHQPRYEVGVFIEEPDENFSISLFPNPTTDWINIKVEDIEENMTAKVFDLYGKLILLKDLEMPQENIDLSNLPSATYLIIILNDQNERVGSWKVQKIW